MKSSRPESYHEVRFDRSNVGLVAQNQNASNPTGQDIQRTMPLLFVEAIRLRLPQVATQHFSSSPLLSIVCVCLRNTRCACMLGKVRQGPPPPPLPRLSTMHPCPHAALVGSASCASLPTSSPGRAGRGRWILSPASSPSPPSLSHCSCSPV